MLWRKRCLVSSFLCQLVASSSPGNGNPFNHVPPGMPTGPGRSPLWPDDGNRRDSGNLAPWRSDEPMQPHLPKPSPKEPPTPSREYYYLDPSNHAVSGPQPLAHLVVWRQQGALPLSTLVSAVADDGGEDLSGEYGGEEPPRWQTLAQVEASLGGSGGGVPPLDPPATPWVPPSAPFRTLDIQAAPNRVPGDDMVGDDEEASPPPGRQLQQPPGNWQTEQEGSHVDSSDFFDAAAAVAAAAAAGQSDLSASPLQSSHRSSPQPSKAPPSKASLELDDDSDDGDDDDNYESMSHQERLMSEHGYPARWRKQAKAAAKAKAAVGEPTIEKGHEADLNQATTATSKASAEKRDQSGGVGDGERRGDGEGGGGGGGGDERDDGNWGALPVNANKKAAQTTTLTTTAPLLSKQGGIATVGFDTTPAAAAAAAAASTNTEHPPSTDYLRYPSDDIDGSSLATGKTDKRSSSSSSSIISEQREGDKRNDFDEQSSPGEGASSATGVAQASETLERRGGERRSGDFFEEGARGGSTSVTTLVESSTTLASPLSVRTSLFQRNTTVVRARGGEEEELATTREEEEERRVVQPQGIFFDVAHKTSAAAPLLPGTNQNKNGGGGGEADNSSGGDVHDRDVNIDDSGGGGGVMFISTTTMVASSLTALPLFSSSPPPPTQKAFPLADANDNDDAGDDNADGGRAVADTRESSHSVTCSVFPEPYGSDNDGGGGSDGGGGGVGIEVDGSHQFRGQQYYSQQGDGREQGGGDEQYYEHLQEQQQPQHQTGLEQQPQQPGLEQQQQQQQQQPQQPGLEHPVFEQELQAAYQSQEEYEEYCRQWQQWQQQQQQQQLFPPPPPSSSSLPSFFGGGFGSMFGSAVGSSGAVGGSSSGSGLLGSVGESFREMTGLLAQGKRLTTTLVSSSSLSASSSGVAQAILHTLVKRSSSSSSSGGADKEGDGEGGDGDKDGGDGGGTAAKDTAAADTTDDSGVPGDSGGLGGGSGGGGSYWSETPEETAARQEWERGLVVDYDLPSSQGYGDDKGVVYGDVAASAGAAAAGEDTGAYAYTHADSAAGGGLLLQPLLSVLPPPLVSIPLHIEGLQEGDGGDARYDSQQQQPQHKKEQKANKGLRACPSLTPSSSSLRSHRQRLSFLPKNPLPASLRFAPSSLGLCFKAAPLTTLALPLAASLRAAAEVAAPSLALALAVHPHLSPTHRPGNTGASPAGPAAGAAAAAAAAAAEGLAEGADDFGKARAKAWQHLLTTLTSTARTRTLDSFKDAGLAFFACLASVWVQAVARVLSAASSSPPFSLTSGGGEGGEGAASESTTKRQFALALSRPALIGAALWLVLAATRAVEASLLRRLQQATRAQHERWLTDAKLRAATLSTTSSSSSSSLSLLAASSETSSEHAQALTKVLAAVVKVVAAAATVAWLFKHFNLVEAAGAGVGGGGGGGVGGLGVGIGKEAAGHLTDLGSCVGGSVTFAARQALNKLTSSVGSSSGAGGRSSGSSGSGGASAAVSAAVANLQRRVLPSLVRKVTSLRGKRGVIGVGGGGGGGIVDDNSLDEILFGGGHTAAAATAAATASAAVVDMVGVAVVSVTTTTAAEAAAAAEATLTAAAATTTAEATLTAAEATLTAAGAAAATTATATGPWSQCVDMFSGVMTAAPPSLSSSPTSTSGVRLNLASWPGLLLAACVAVVVIEATFAAAMALFPPPPPPPPRVSAVSSLPSPQQQQRGQGSSSGGIRAQQLVCGLGSPEECLEAGSNGLTLTTLLPLALNKDHAAVAARDESGGSGGDGEEEASEAVFSSSHCSQRRLGHPLKRTVLLLQSAVRLLVLTLAAAWRFTLNLAAKGANAATAVLVTHTAITALAAVTSSATYTAPPPPPPPPLTLFSPVSSSLLAALGVALAFALSAAAGHAALVEVAKSVRGLSLLQPCRHRHPSSSSSLTMAEALACARKEDAAASDDLSKLWEKMEQDAYHLVAGSSSGGGGGDQGRYAFADPSAPSSASASVVPRGPHPSDGVRLSNVWVSAPGGNEESGGGGGGGGEAEAATGVERGTRQRRPTEHFAVKGLSLHVPGGSVAVVVGGVGAGKSSLMDALAAGRQGGEGGNGGDGGSDNRQQEGRPRVAQGAVVLQGEAWSSQWGVASSATPEPSVGRLNSSSSRDGRDSPPPVGRWWAGRAWGGWKASLGLLRQTPARFGSLSLIDNVVVGASPALLLLSPLPPAPPPPLTSENKGNNGWLSPSAKAVAAAESVASASLSLAGASALVDKLPLGLHTRLSCLSTAAPAAVAPAAVAFSGGEWAAVALARSVAGLVAGTSSLVLLDEPCPLPASFSAAGAGDQGGSAGGLGSGSEEEAVEEAEVAFMERLVAAAAERPWCAVVVATRRPRLALFSDQVVVLGPGGEVLEQGHPETLLTQFPGGAFARMLGAAAPAAAAGVSAAPAAAPGDYLHEEGRF